MPRLVRRIPSYRKHRASGSAVVTLSGQVFYLGPHGTKVSRLEYDRSVSEWLAPGSVPRSRCPRGGRRPHDRRANCPLREVRQGLVPQGWRCNERSRLHLKRSQSAQGSLWPGTRQFLWAPQAAGPPAGHDPRRLDPQEHQQADSADLSLTCDILDQVTEFPATDPGWQHWPAGRSSPWWWTTEDLRVYLSALIARDRQRGEDRTVREVVATFEGLAGSAKQKRVLNQTGLARAKLSSFVSGGVASGTTVRPARVRWSSSSVRTGRRLA